VIIQPKPKRGYFEIGETIDLWGWRFLVTDGGQHVVRLNVMKEAPGAAKRRMPLLGELVEVKGLVLVVAKVDLRGVILAVIPPVKVPGKALDPTDEIEIIE
jgi:hypothetical protein